MVDKKHIFDNVVDFIEESPKWTLFWVLAFLTLSFFGFPYAVTNWNWGVSFDSATGVIGDTIGGIVNPLIALFASFLTFIAFWVQYKANKQQKEDLEKERFENKFYEMIRLYKENINEMVIEGYEFENLTAEELNHHVEFHGHDVPYPVGKKVKKTTQGRKVFVTAYNELQACYTICNLEIGKEPQVDERYLIKLAYRFLYSGIGSNAPIGVDNSVANDSTYIGRCIKALNDARVFHNKDKERIYTFPGSNIRINMFFKYKPFSGHSTRFGHYYRHLFETVKYVVNQNNTLISYDKKRDYLKLLRAQMSDHEQLMLYYNYLSDFGSRWEDRTNPLNENNYFSKYRMIHNIPLRLANIGINILDEFEPAIAYIRQQAIADGKSYEMFEQLEN